MKSEILRDYEPKHSECLCSALTFPLSLPTKRGYALLFTEHLSQAIFQHISKSLSKTILKYENLLIMGDLNVDVNRKFLNDLNKTIIAFDNENPDQNYVLNDRF